MVCLHRNKRSNQRSNLPRNTKHNRRIHNNRRPSPNNGNLFKQHRNSFLKRNKLHRRPRLDKNIRQRNRNPNRNIRKQRMGKIHNKQSISLRTTNKTHTCRNQPNKRKHKHVHLQHKRNCRYPASKRPHKRRI